MIERRKEKTPSKLFFNEAPPEIKILRNLRDSLNFRVRHLVQGNFCSATAFFVGLFVAGDNRESPWLEESRSGQRVKKELFQEMSYDKESEYHYHVLLA